MSSQGRNIIKTVRGQTITSRPQRNFLRLPDLESAMEYEDSAIDVHRYPSHVKADEPKQGRRSQPRKLGPNSKPSKDRV
jgi:hypothetical protein